MVSFTVLGRRITIRFGFCMTLLCLVLLMGDGVLPCLCCCLLHECGHLLACLLLRLRMRELSFGYSGLTLRLHPGDALLPIGKAALLHGSGILCSLFFAGVFALLSMVWEAGALWCRVSLSLTLFHLIPARNLDGGRLFSLLGERLLSGDRLELWETLGDGIAFLIFALFAAGALWSGNAPAALMAGMLALCSICSVGRQDTV